MRWFKEIRRDGGARDVWGTWHPVNLAKDCEPGEKARPPRKVAATVIQSIEMEIIAPIFDIAARYGDGYQFGITLFQHDGATISFHNRSKREKAMNLLRDAVEGRARELGVETILEFDDLEAITPLVVVPAGEEKVVKIVAVPETDSPIDESIPGPMSRCEDRAHLADDVKDRIAFDGEHEQLKPLTKTHVPYSALDVGAAA